MTAPARRTVLQRLPAGLLIAAFPTLIGLLTGATAFPGGSFIPWRPLMVDLDVYRRAGQVVLAGGDIYHLANSLPFLYPPFAALLAVAPAVLPGVLVQFAWVFGNVVAVLAILYRLGVSGWRLSLVAAIAVYVVEPVNQTLGYGQVGIFLVALVLLDLVPGPRLLPRRLWPEGVLTGIATAVKLTPAIFAVYLFAARKGRSAITTAITMVAVSVVSAVALPAESIGYWGRLLNGDTGLGGSIIYYTNQSAFGAWLRLFGFGAAGLGLVVCAVIAVLGVWAGMLWHARGKIALAVSLVGVAGLLASPVSWSHHFVWVVPLAVVLLDRSLPPYLCFLGWVFVAWVASAPFKRLRNGGDVELQYVWWENLLDSVTPALGLGLIVVAIVAGTVASRRASNLVPALRRSR